MFLCKESVLSQEFTKILLLSETHRRPNGDLLETHRRPTCLIGDPLETSTCFIGDRHASLETHRKPTCLIKNPPEIDMPDKSPYIIAKYINKKKYTKISIYFNIYVLKFRLDSAGMLVSYGFLIRHVGLQ